MADYGIKIAKPGYDITDPSLGNYIFHSTYPLLKIKRIDTGNAPSTSGVESLIATIPHNLGYVPMFDVLVSFDNTNWYPQSYYVDYEGLGTLHYMKCFTDNTNLYIYSFQNDGSPTVYYKSVIYYDPLNP